MARAACLALVVILGTTPDVSQLFRFGFQQGQPADPEKSAPQGTLPPASDTDAGKQSSSSPSSSSAISRGERMSDGMRIAIIRAISGEFVRAQIPLPGGKQGLHIPANQPFVQQVDKASPDMPDSPHVFLVTRAPVIHPGDHVQITRIEFREKSIVLDINGGGVQKFHIRDHLQLGLGGTIPVGSGSQPGAPNAEGSGSTLYIDFGRKLPEITPDELKLRLAPILDFSRERSANVQYAETLPPEFQQAIKDRMAAVGMDHDMVLAAMGRPDRKVRERDADGNDTEDWIYGNPPERTIFVTFIGEKVTRVRQFP